MEFKNRQKILNIFQNSIMSVFAIMIICIILQASLDVDFSKGNCIEILKHSLICRVFCICIIISVTLIIIVIKLKRNKDENN